MGEIVSEVCRMGTKEKPGQPLSEPPMPSGKPQAGISSNRFLPPTTPCLVEATTERSLPGSPPPLLLFVSTQGFSL